jgi:hypothetical protein
MYTAAYNRTAATPSASRLSSESAASKVTSVCDAVRHALEQLGADRLILCFVMQNGWVCHFIEDVKEFY